MFPPPCPSSAFGLRGWDKVGNGRGQCQCQCQDDVLEGGREGSGGRQDPTKATAPLIFSRWVSNRPGGGQVLFKAMRGQPAGYGQKVPPGQPTIRGVPVGAPPGRGPKEGVARGRKALLGWQSPPPPLLPHSSFRCCLRSSYKKAPLILAFPDRPRSIAR